MTDTRRLNCCGQPACDHPAEPVPPRYMLRVAVRHYLIEKMRVLPRGWRP